MQLLFDAIVSGLLLGLFYAGLAVGVTISFGMLDIANLAHSAIIVVAAFAVFKLNDALGLDSLLCGLALTPIFFALGYLIQALYRVSFETRGKDSMRGLTFFFGLMFIAESALILTFGVDLRTADASYVEGVHRVGGFVIENHLLVPAGVSLLMLVLIAAFLRYTFFGRAIRAGAQDKLALRIVGVDPDRVRRIAFGLSIATAPIAGALLLLLQPVDPLLGREFLGRIFAICVLGGLGSLLGTAIGAITLGLSESIISTFFGPSWAPAIGFALLLAILAVRPSGLLGR